MVAVHEPSVAITVPRVVEYQYHQRQSLCRQFSGIKLKTRQILPILFSSPQRSRSRCQSGLSFLVTGFLHLTETHLLLCRSRDDYKVCEGTMYKVEQQLPRQAYPADSAAGITEDQLPHRPLACRLSTRCQLNCTEAPRLAPGGGRQRLAARVAQVCPLLPFQHDSPSSLRSSICSFCRF